MTTKRKRSLEAVVGKETYALWTDMLRRLVPEGRTHRLSVVVASMLQYAYLIASENQDDEDDEDGVAQALLDSGEGGDPEEVGEYLYDIVNQLFKDAKVKHKRTSARGEDYSIAESALEEYVSWFDMPWES
ncbi:MAG TPA: hypothetical protein VLG46_08660 [Anaerolineae bacterium]|nr:hypothetical protein [Anaerolineae bacterium]